MSPPSKLQLDVEHLRHTSRDAVENSQTTPEPGPTAPAQSSPTPAREVQTFSDVCLADSPRYNSVAIGKYTAQGTPRKLYDLEQLQASPSPAKAPRPPLVPCHRRAHSDAPSLPDLSSTLREDLDCSGRQYSADNLPLSANFRDHPAALRSNSASNLKGSSYRSFQDANLGSSSLECRELENKSGPVSWKAWLAKDLLLILTVLGVLVGILLGFVLRPAHLSDNVIELVGFPGEIMLRMLKMLVLPLVAGSMISGVCSLRNSDSSIASVARNTFLYYATTTLTAVILGIALVNIIGPGHGEPLAGGDVSKCHDHGLHKTQADPGESVSALDALLRVFRSIFPDNIAEAAVDMNILGIITISLLFGLALASVGSQAEPIINGVEVFNSCVSKIVVWVLWVSPVGVASLIAAAMIRACDLLQTVIALGMWVCTVLVGLAIFGALLLPFLLWILTRHNPWMFLRKFSRALVLAFGTSSSSAALPVAMDCAAKFGCNDSIIKFVLPLGTTINMNGTALYEAVTVIFIAQAHGVSLGFAGTLVVAFTATLAAVGAAAIPSAGLVTMLMVLQAVNLEQFAGDLAIILAIDWLLDRCRTAVNLMSDCLAVVVVDHLAKHAHGREYSQIEMSV